MQSFTANNTDHFYHAVSGKDSPVIFWGHGWGQDHKAFLPLASSLHSLGAHTLLDFPGFGASARPRESWNTQDYADAIAAHLKQANTGPVIWIGHSFGGRVGIQLASRHPELVQALVLIAGAGLKRKRSPLKSLFFKGRIASYKALKKLVPFGLSQDWLQSRFGSRDYKNAGPMRDIFLKTIAEDLSPQAAQIKAPTLLIYGENDQETPPEFGRHYKDLIPNSALHILTGLDHYSVLGSGRHQVANLLQAFIKDLDDHKQDLHSSLR